jgi:hypothetical protein
MQTMKLSETVTVADEKGAFLFGGKAAGRKNPKKELVTVRAEFLARGIVKLIAEDGTEVLHSRTGTVVFAGPVNGQAEEPKKAPRKKAAKKAPEVIHATAEDRVNYENAVARGAKIEKIESVPGGVAAKKAEKAPEKPAKKPGKAPWNFRDLARSAATETARRYWQSVVDQYEG